MFCTFIIINTAVVTNTLSHWLHCRHCHY